MKHITVACLFSVILGAAPQVRDAATTPATGTAQISGRVQADEPSSGPSPVRRFTMTLTGERTGFRLSAVTDDAGQFAFTNLPADRYSLSAAKAGYVPWNYGSKRAGGSARRLSLPRASASRLR